MAIKFKIKDLMRERGMSLNELTELLGKTTAGTSLLANGHVAALKIDTLDILCDIFDCGPGDILLNLPEPGRPRGKDFKPFKKKK